MTKSASAAAIDFRELRRSMRASARRRGRGNGGRVENGGVENEHDDGDGDDANDAGNAAAVVTNDGAEDPANPSLPVGRNGDKDGVEDEDAEGDIDGPVPPVLDASLSSLSSSSSSSSTTDDGDDNLTRYRVGWLHHVHYISKFLSTEYVNDVLLPWLLSRPDVVDGEDGGGNGNNMRWKTLRHARRRVMLVDATDPERMAMPAVLRRIVDALVDTGFVPSSSGSGEEGSSFRPNHVLINEYRPGEGILPHTDGPAYHPRTATISISVGDGGDVGRGCHADDDDGDTSAAATVTGVLFKFRPRLTADEIGGDDGNGSDDVIMEVMLGGHGSLVVFSDDAYSNHCHSIDEVTTEVATKGRCVNCDGGTVIVRAGRRISLTFRHKYVA